MPSKSSYLGGIWEAGVKSFKFHAKRIIGKLALTLEEFLIITVQIEGILNSRPLIPLSAEVANFEVLTPGHFLIGRAFNAIVEPDLCSVNTNKLDKYRKITKIVQNIWKEKPYTFTLGNSTPSLGEFAGSKSTLLRGLRPFPDLLSSDSTVLRGLPIVFPLSLKGPHKGSLKNPVFSSDSLTPLTSSLSYHHSPNYHSVIACSSAAPVGLGSLDLLQPLSVSAQWTPMSRCTL
ncbi:DUF5641 domain-containing protein [Trichonephila clavipes]|nr:DUF5641 domain-containing protein [Trichonephila clavipes]